MKFILDENVPRSIYKYLKSRGFDVDYVPGGIKKGQALIRAFGYCLAWRLSCLRSLG